MKENQKRVISASRRVDMVAFFPNRLAEFLQKRCPPDRVHTVVLWTKSPENLLSHRVLQDILNTYDQCYLHLTVTGMGGSFLEPGIPPTSKTLALLPGLIDFLGDPRRLRIRFDPIVHLHLPDNSIYSNLLHFESIAKSAEKHHVHDITLSWMQIYEKSVKRMADLGIVYAKGEKGRWTKEWEWISKTARAIGVHLHGCCVPGMRVSRCVDGELLTILHPNLDQAVLKRAGGQRELCGCTESWDIGWYYPCPGRCIYCYARPMASSRLSGKKPV